jgi:hypothetical protein
VRFQVLTAASKQMTVFWDVASCGAVKLTAIPEVLTAPIIRAMKETVTTSKMSVTFYDTTQHNITKDSHLHV